MENRSFDHFLGWVPGAAGRQQGLTYLDDAGQPHTTIAGGGHFLQEDKGEELAAVIADFVSRTP